VSEGAGLLLGGLLLSGPGLKLKSLSFCNKDRSHSFLLSPVWQPLSAAVQPSPLPGCSFGEIVTGTPLSLSRGGKVTTNPLPLCLVSGGNLSSSS
jgi:hypothetical protein